VYVKVYVGLIDGEGVQVGVMDGGVGVREVAVAVQV